MKRLCIILILSLCVLCGYAQDTMRFRDVLKIYNKRLNNIGNSMIGIDSNIAWKISANDNDIYQKLIDLDTGTAKSYMTDHIIFLDSLSNQLNRKSVPDSTKLNYLKAYYANTVWYKTQELNASLDKCPECFLVRKISVTVLKKVSDQKLDTVRCASVAYRKVFASDIAGKKETLTSFPCPEHVQSVSTGPNYSFVVHYNGRDIPFKKPVNVGSALTDIQQISLVIEKN